MNFTVFNHNFFSCSSSGIACEETQIKDFLFAFVRGTVNQVGVTIRRNILDP
jgi:hypothetical protein